MVGQSMSQNDIGFACALLIDTEGRLLLQQRDEIPGIRFPGTVGCFGGRRENGESTLECVVREIYEETGYFVAPERFRHLVIYDGIVDTDGTTGQGEIFIADGIPADRLVVTEGSLLIVPRAEVPKIEHKLAPSANLALMTWLG